MHNGDHISIPIHGTADIFHGFCVHRFGSCALQICPSHRKKEDYLNKLPAVPRLEFWGWSTGGSRRGQKTAKNQLKTCSKHMHTHTRTCTDLENDIRKLCIGSCSQLVNVSKLSPLGLVRHPITINYRPLETLTRLGQGPIYGIYIYV